MIAVNQTLPPGTDLSSLPDGDYFLSINTWLEDGGKVSDWIPGKTDYHYRTQSPGAALFDAVDFLHNLNPPSDAPLIGIYCSAYGNARHWGFWTYEQWRAFLQEVMTVVPENSKFIFLGAEYDLQIAEYLHAWLGSIDRESYLTLGAFHIGATIAVISALDYFFVFPSGLGFLADVVNTPHTMWFPGNLGNMRGTFCDPANYSSGLTQHDLFSDPSIAFQRFKMLGLKHFEERLCRRKS
jgi:hypothetical protein